jgi:basic amino acid/polyamine antiporter, APA family
MVLYVLACLVLTGMVSFKDISSESAFSSAFKTVGLMSRDGLLPKWFGKTNTKRQVPSRMTWVLGIASAVIGGFLPIGQAAELTNIGILLAFFVVCVAVIVLRYRKPDLPRSFRCPGMPVVPAVGVVFSIWLITFLKPETWLRFAIWFVIGTAVYFGYSCRHSLLAQGDSENAS